MLTPRKSLKDCAQLGTMGGIGKVTRQYVYVAIVVCIGALQSSICLGQENPLNPNYCEIQPFGTQDGWITKPKLSGGKQGFGQEIHGVSDVNGDGLGDWIVEHGQVDTVFGTRTPHELLLYYGESTGIPSSRTGKRIGPDELNSTTQFLCSGDYDADLNIDLVVAIELFSDTSGGIGQYHPKRIVVYWGRKNGLYSNHDTSHLLNPGEYWLGLYPKGGHTIQGDNSESDAILIWGHWTLDMENVIETARIHIFDLPAGSRWGRNGQSRVPSWQWWSPPFGDKMQILDHDGDGEPDILIIHQDQADSVVVSTLYGTNVNRFDTTSTESISLQRANGRVAEMTDITGDGIPDLIVNAGSQELIKIFIGRRGHRLKEQYGTGIDPPDVPGGRPFSRPWAQISLPNTINPSWGRIGFEPLWDLGDVGNDGIADVVVAARPYMYVYSTGKYSDSYIDATLAVPGGGVNGLTYATRLGDIDGSGYDAIAVSYGYAPGGIAFFHTSKCVEDAGGNVVPLPPGTGRPTTSVEEESTTAITGLAMDLRFKIAPNPSSGGVQLQWASIGTAHVSVSDVLGNECGRWITPDNSLKLDLTGWSKGTYIITVHTSIGMASEEIVLQ